MYIMLVVVVMVSTIYQLCGKVSCQDGLYQENINIYENLFQRRGIRENLLG